MTVQCILCDDRGKKPLILSNGHYPEAVEDLTLAWGSTLCKILELDDVYQSFFAGCSYCLSCQEKVCTAEFSLTAIAKLHKQLNQVSDDIKENLLRDHPNWTISEVVGALCGIKLEVNDSETLDSTDNQHRILSPYPRWKRNSRPNNPTSKLSTSGRSTRNSKRLLNKHIARNTMELHLETKIIETKTVGERTEMDLDSDLDFVDDDPDYSDYDPDYVDDHCNVDNLDDEGNTNLQEHIQNKNKETAESFIRNVKFVCNDPSCEGQNEFPDIGKVKIHLLEEHKGKGLKTKYHCAQCPQQFIKMSHLKRHILARHKPTPAILCPTCGLIFVESKALKAHQQACGKLPEHTSNIPSFLYCNYVECSRILFSTTHQIRKHLRNQHNLDGDPLKFIYHCNECDSRFKTPPSLQQHKGKCHQVKPTLPCPSCDKYFFNQTSIYNHIKNSHAPLQLLPKCGLCNKIFQQVEDVQEHEKLHGEDTPFDCVICGLRLSTTIALHRHVNDLHEILPFKCEEPGCGKTFDKKQALRRHQIAKHTDQSAMTHACELCPAKFRIPSDLREHMTTTHCTKQYDCLIEGCTVKFKRISTRNKHWRDVHKMGDQTKTFGCKICSKKFFTGVALAQHEIHHGDARPYMCELCSATFKSHGNLYTHMMVHKRTGNVFSVRSAKRKQRLIPIGVSSFNGGAKAGA